MRAALYVVAAVAVALLAPDGMPWEVRLVALVVAFVAGSLLLAGDHEVRA